MVPSEETHWTQIKLTFPVSKQLPLAQPLSVATVIVSVLWYAVSGKLTSQKE